MTRPLISSLYVLLGVVLGSGVSFGATPEACVALRTADFSKIPDAPTQVVTASYEAADDIIPAHCSVSAITAPNIGIELRIPLDEWNAKILQEGCGGSCGQALIWRADDALSRGYAVTTTDQGHRGSLADSKWAYNDIVAELNAGYRATYLIQVVSEYIVEYLLGQPAELSYFRGGSNGGRQAMRSAQVFPGQFNGIIAGCAPPGGDATLNGLWGMTVNFDDNDQPILTADILPRVHEAAVQACDMDDGVADGVIGNPSQCTFKPEDLACSSGADRPCLTSQQVEVLGQIYDGPRNSAGAKLVIAGPGIGSELNWRSFVPTQGDGLASQRRERRVDSLRYTSFLRDPGPNYSFDDFDWDRDPPRMRAMSPIFASLNPDLRPLAASGAKMIMYTGTQDYIPTRTMTDYYQAAERVLGGRKIAQNTVRLFVIPGMNHCIGGPGAGFIDYLSYLETWVEQGKAPDHMLGRSPKDWNEVDRPGIANSTLAREHLFRDRARLSNITAFSRPHYPYPQRYVYQGTGNSSEAARFQPISEEDFEAVTRQGVQGIGWYVVRADDGGPLVSFYRDALGLGDFRSWSDGGMLWGGGTTVFEPNVLEDAEAQTYTLVSDSPFIPVFASRDLDETLARLSETVGITRSTAVERADGILYFRDPKGNLFGLKESSDAPEPHQITAEKALAQDLVGLSQLLMHTANPEAVADWYEKIVGMRSIERSTGAFLLDMGDGTTLHIEAGGSEPVVPTDRKQVTSAPVYRVYGLDDLMARLEKSGTPMIQLFDQTGGRIWYGLDPDGHLVGFQERRLPSRDLSKWTTRLPEDVYARSLWRSETP